MRVLFDTNVLLDSLLQRQPFANAAGRLIGRVELRVIEGFLGATTVTTLHYLLAKVRGPRAALGTVRRLLTIFRVAPVDDKTLVLAAGLPFDDFEDAVLYQSALLVEVDAIVTRDPRGFRKAEIAVYSPPGLEEVLPRLPD